MSRGNGSGDVEALRAEIQRTRAELGQTVQALAAKADVKARLRGSADRARQRVRDQTSHTADVMRGSVRKAGNRARRNAAPLVLVAAGAAVAVLLLVVRRRRG